MAAPMVRIISSSSTATTSASQLDPLPSHSTEHSHRRFFIGPMPQKVLPSAEELKRLSKRNSFFRHSTDSEEGLARIIKDNARSFFLREGGREEDWGENEEQSTREEMYRRWKESEWGVALNRLRGQSGSKSQRNASANTWIGGSFEVGNIAGINIIQEAETLSLVSSRASAQRSTSFIPLDSTPKPLVSPSDAPPKSLLAETFVTAPSEPSETSKTQMQTRSPIISPTTPDRGLLLPDEPEASGVASPSSSTALLPPSVSRRRDSSLSQAQSEPARRPIIKLPSFSKTTNSPNKGKKAVHYDLSPIASTPSLPPASPADVLERSGTDVSGTSAGAMSAAAVNDDQISWGDIVLRDRMLVRVNSTDLTDQFSRFDESVHRVTRDLKFEDWGEFLVVWRKDMIEVYGNYTIPGKELVTGHKHLAHIIPLKNDKTRLFLYSFVDLTFCLTAPPTSRRFNPAKAKWSIHSAKEGSNIFVFKLKSRTRAFDWIWQLWKHRGGTLPPVVEIRNPRLDSKLKIDMPNVDSMQTYKTFSRENLIALSIQSLRDVTDWKNVIERQLSQGNVLQLCWRMDSYLDWIWLDDDVDGRPRDWAVLCGLALKECKNPVHLEIRMAQHNSGILHEKDGTRLTEPPAIEGYLDRIKPNTQNKQAIYLATHDGNLFVLKPATAHPPTPLGAELQLLDSEGDENYAETLRVSEVRRGVQQVHDATGVVDLRSILIVRRAEHPVMQHTHDVKEPDDDNWASAWQEPQMSESDRTDEGGEESLNKAEDKRLLKTRRSFELLLTNGHILRFEAYSCSVSLEWISKLRALVHYWRMKHRSDATEEMELAQTYREPVTPHIYAQADKTTYAESPVDPSAPLPALGSMYNWCVLEGCKPIVKFGKVFMRQGLHGQYRLVDLVLVPESLLNFRVSPKSVLHSSVRKKINLTDAYVCSGFFAAQLLPSGQFNPNANNVPRRYLDGLETDDPEEDRLFAISYRNAAAAQEPESTSTASLKDDRSVAGETRIPSLGAKRKIVLFRTRSKLERDAWCWALNCEIEKAVRARREREQKMRESGRLMDL